jgi:hypothetical protein
MEKLRIVTFKVFGWEIAHAAAARRPPISLDTMVARTGGYTYDVGVWDLSIVHGSIFCRAVPNLSVTIRNFCIAMVVGAKTPPTSARLRLDDAPTPSMAVRELAMMAFTSLQGAY